MTLRDFARIPRAEAMPAHCLRCPRNEDLFDLGADPLPGYGVAYLCSVCTAAFLQALGSVPASQVNAQAELRDAEISRLQGQLDEATRRANAPTERIRTVLKGFTNDVERAARDLVRDLGRAADGSGDLPRPAAHEDDIRPAPVPDEPAGEERAGDAAPERPVPGGDEGDARQLLLARLGIAGGGAGEPVGFEPAVDEAPHGDGEAGDVWSLLERDGAGEAGEFDDDVPRD